MGYNQLATASPLVFNNASHDSRDWEQTPLNKAASGGICEEWRLQSMPFFNQRWHTDTFALHFNPLSRNKYYPSSDLFRVGQRAGPAYLVLWNATNASGCDLTARNMWKEKSGYASRSSCYKSYGECFPEVLR